MDSKTSAFAVLRLYVVSIVAVIILILFTRLLISLSGFGQVYAPDLVARKLAPGMSYEQCFGLLGRKPPSVSEEGIVFIPISSSGIGSVFEPQHNTRLLIVDGKLKNIFVKCVHNVQDFEYSIWPESAEDIQGSLE